MKRLIVFCIMIVQFGCKPAGRTYKIGLQAIPEKIDPINNEINLFHYINSNLYSPLFEVGEGDEIRSHFLDMSKTRALAGFKTFRLCLKTGIKYADDSVIRSADLIRAIKRAHRDQQDLQPLNQVAEDDECVVVQLATKDLRYFYRLTRVNSTVIKAGSESLSVPVGFGPYSLVEHTARKIVLEKNKRNDDDGGRLNRVEFHLVEDMRAAENLQLDDWNHLSRIGMPKEIKEEYRQIRRPILKTYSVFLKIKDPQVRRQFLSCFDRPEFIAATGLQLSAVPGILPRGFPGFDVDQDAGKKCVKLKTPVRYVYKNIRHSLYEKLQRFFAGFSAKSGILVDVQKTDVAEQFDDLYSDKEFLVLSGIDSEEPRPEDFLNIFSTKKRVIFEELPGYKKTIQQAARSQNLKSKNSLFAKAHKILLDSGYLISLGQLEKTQYYPKDLTGISWIGRSLSFPNLSRIRVIR